MTRDQQIVEASLRLPYLKNQDQQLCFQQGAVWADHNPAWQGETIYHVTVSGHASNNKGKWIDNEVRTEFNNIIISEPNIRQLRHTLELIVSKAGQLFPRSTDLQMRDIRLGADNRELSINIYTRKSSDYADIVVILSPVNAKLEYLL